STRFDVSIDFRRSGWKSPANSPDRPSLETHSMPSVALVTGSATGVGRACAVRLAQAGFDVVVNYSRSKAEAEETCQLVEAEGRQAWLIACDVSDDQQVRAMLAQIEAECGRLDVLVNNAGCTSFIEHSDLEAMTEEIW